MTGQSANRELAERQRRRHFVAISREFRALIDPQTRLFWD